MKFALIVVMLILLSGGGVLSWNVLSPESPSIQTATVMKGDIISFVQASGTAESEVDVKLTSGVAGKVVAVNAKVGERVEAGEILVQLENRSAAALLERARAQLSLRIHQYELDRLTLKRLTRTVKSGGVSTQVLHEARTNRDMAKSSVELARADLEFAEVQYHDRALYSPVSGVMVDSHATVGEWTGRVDSDHIFEPKHLVRIINPEQMYIQSNIDSADLASVAIAQQVEVRCDQFPGEIWTEHVIGIAQVIHENDGVSTSQIRISLDGPPGVIRVGTQLDLKFVLAKRENVLTIPFSAVKVNGEETVVAVMESGQVRNQSITMGLEGIAELEVIDGVQEGQEIVVWSGNYNYQQ